MLKSWDRFRYICDFYSSLDVPIICQRWFQTGYSNIYLEYYVFSPNAKFILLETGMSILVLKK